VTHIIESCSSRAYGCPSVWLRDRLVGLPISSLLFIYPGTISYWGSRFMGVLDLRHLWVVSIDLQRNYLY